MADYKPIRSPLDGPKIDFDLLRQWGKELKRQTWDFLKKWGKNLWSVDDVTCDPEMAVRFCDDFRKEWSTHKSLPDRVILRALMRRRKNPPKGKDGKIKP